jgi:hypothetical protein
LLRRTRPENAVDIVSLYPAPSYTPSSVEDDSAPYGGRIS